MVVTPPLVMLIEPSNSATPKPPSIGPPQKLVPRTPITATGVVIVASREALADSTPET